jgi:hypothetical protein
LHNFAEGLAIGQAAGTDEIALATLLVIGFGLHNATEGFGIVAPLADADPGDARPSWTLLLTLGAIGGGPTFVGTAVGHAFTSQVMSVAFFALAAGSILYVVVQLVGVASRSRIDLLAYGLLIGLVAGLPPTPSSSPPASSPAKRCSARVDPDPRFRLGRTTGSGDRDVGDYDSYGAQRHSRGRGAPSTAPRTD